MCRSHGNRRKRKGKIKKCLKIISDLILEIRTCFLQNSFHSPSFQESEIVLQMISCFSTNTWSTLIKCIGVSFVFPKMLVEHHFASVPTARIQLCTLSTQGSCTRIAGQCRLGGSLGWFLASSAAGGCPGAGWQKDLPL